MYSCGRLCLSFFRLSILCQLQEFTHEASRSKLVLRWRPALSPHPAVANNAIKSGQRWSAVCVHKYIYIYPCYFGQSSATFNFFVSSASPFPSVLYPPSARRPRRRRSGNGNRERSDTFRLDREARREAFHIAERFS